MSSSSTKGLPKSQFHHYVPQFILRKFSDYHELNAGYIEKGSESSKAQKTAKRNSRVRYLTLEHGYEAAGLDTHKVERTFGAQDMYCGTGANIDKRQEIENKLTGLEQKASKILKTIETDLVQGRSTTVLRRPEKDTLRKFLFIMLYRNRTLHSRFEKTAEAYDCADRETLLKYMREKGFVTPKDVWLANINAFLEVRLGHDRNRWLADLKATTDPDGATRFSKHLESTFLSFCTPVDQDDEFILTQNAFSVFEGPSDHTGWTDWHVFSPVSPKLIIVMQQNVLKLPAHLEQLGLGKWPKPRGDFHGLAKSWLEDLPIARPTTSYNPIVSGNGGARSEIFSENDIFTFKFFPISTVHTRSSIHCFWRKVSTRNLSRTKQIEASAELWSLI